MSGWQKGDLALCIKVGPWTYTPNSARKGELIDIRPGSINAVERVVQNVDGLFLGFGPKGTGLFRARRFRRIRPHLPDAEDHETIELLNRERLPA